MNSIIIKERSIGPEEPVFVIAEAGVNHNGSMEIAKELIDIATDAGADAVKFQKRNLPQTYLRSIVDDPAIAEMGIEYTVSNLKDVMLTDDQFGELEAYCGEQGIQFLCSPWDISSVDFLETMELPIYKVGSPDMTNFVLLERLAQTGRPLLISTGMAEETEIDATVQFLNELEVEFGLLHCRSEYPAALHNLNLSFMEELQERYDVPVGYSGHERGIAISTAAVAMGACVIERHFTLSRDMEGPDHAASLGPPGIKKLIRDIRNLEEAQGAPRRYITRGEYNNRVALAKSLTTTRDMSAGETVRREDVTAKSPAKGISPQQLHAVVGERLRRDVPADTPFQWEDMAAEAFEETRPALDNWGVVVRFGDIDRHDWGDPDVFEFRINGADLDRQFDIAERDKRLGVHAPEQKGHAVVDLSARDETARMQAVEIMQQVIDKVRDDIKPAFASESPYIVIHPGGITEHTQALDAIPDMNEALRTSMYELDDAGVTLLLENMPPLPWIFGGQQFHNNFMNADEIAGFCEDTGVGLCYDTSHAKLWCNYADVELASHMRELMPYTEYLHVADAIGIDGEGIQIGEGEIEWGAISPLLKRFDGPIVTEIWRGHERQGEGFKLAAERLSELIGGV
jgi:N-acetylneuraminate synthase